MVQQQRKDWKRSTSHTAPLGKTCCYYLYDKNKVLGSDFKLYVVSTLYPSNQRIKLIIKYIDVMKHVLF